MVCQNRRTKEIAERLYLSEFTIYTIEKTSSRKLEIGDSTILCMTLQLKII
ncbi:hypothetical protein [Pedobacter sp. PACM 27299]|uniref:hypothetical protein n=1 Tax=Pedobacter sp. PACM 27299 TaxID=1727164 RepID=UPI0009EBAE49